MEERRPSARLAVLLGALGALTLPLAIAGTRWSGSYDLVHSLFAIPIAAVLGIAAVLIARRARRAAEGSIRPVAPAASVAWGRWLGVLAVCLASSGAIAALVYGVLTYLGDR